METARRCMEVIELSALVAEKGNPNSITDVGVGAIMASSGMDGALYNVRINLSSIKDSTFVENTEKEMNDMANLKEDMLKDVLSKVQEKL
jgi:formiminotetrahydrofolate cyclodeaminase